jgi:hypothetical protein
VAFGKSGLIRGVAFGKSGLIREGTTVAGNQYIHVHV